LIFVEGARNVETVCGLLFGWYVKASTRAARRDQAVQDALDQAAALVLRPSEDWQPIDTAPKDGRWFLGWNEDCGHFVWRDGPGLIAGENPEPTHWRPLPPVPGTEDR
jgi:hypothetical protein